MFLITSAAYINPGMASEFGKLPPCMLPVQNRRLYEHQIALVPEGEEVILSLPQGYSLSAFDEKSLSKLNVKVVYVPSGVSLGESVVYVLNVCGKYFQPLKILHGDTLFSKIDNSVDVCSVANAEDAYDWASVGQNDSRVYSGFFSFSDQSLLIQKITECNYRFIDGIEAYSKQIKLEYVELPNWMDFSLVNSYYRSVSKLTTQRVFNSMQVSRYSVRKSSADVRKMEAESNWILSLPPSLKHYAPSIWNRGIQNSEGYYEIEYYYLSSLANLYVFGKNAPYVWEEIIDACCNYLDDEFLYKPDNLLLVAQQNDKLYFEKTIERVNSYAMKVGLSLNECWTLNGKELPSLQTIISETSKMIVKKDARFATLMHGDLCFSNILYDFKSKSIKVIDPRGIDADGTMSVFGDFRYDVAKLAHSIIGLYDFIISGMYDYQENNPYDVSLRFEHNQIIEHVQDYFCSKTFGNYTMDELSTYAILVHLFLSMLPLHCDHPERQKAMLANALRIYSQFIAK